MMKSELLQQYGKYQSMPEFHQGWDDYMANKWNHSYETEQAILAWQKGHEAAKRWINRRV